jgi:hypothetical protein
LERTY